MYFSSIAEEVGVNKGVRKYRDQLINQRAQGGRSWEKKFLYEKNLKLITMGQGTIIRDLRVLSSSIPFFVWLFW